jgi:hypothetical protein
MRARVTLAEARPADGMVARPQKKGKKAKEPGLRVAAARGDPHQVEIPSCEEVGLIGGGQERRGEIVVEPAKRDLAERLIEVNALVPDAPPTVSPETSESQT